MAQVSYCQHENDKLQDQVEEEIEGKNEITRQLSKAHAETQQWKSRFENEGLVNSEEMEDSKRRLTIRSQELQEKLDASNTRVASLEKIRQKLLGELDDAQVSILFWR